VHGGLIDLIGSRQGAGSLVSNSGIEFYCKEGIKDLRIWSEHDDVGEIVQVAYLR